MTSSTDQEALSRSGSPGSTGEQTVDSSNDKAIKGEPHEQGESDIKSAKDSKESSRPRRKKARRACHACQRAHLTCGDERPCQRCIKRGLADQCCDGVRKKAKYLHDTPNEAFLPGGMSHYSYMNGMRNAPRGSQDVSFNLSSPASDVFNQMTPQTGAYPVYRQATSPTQVPEGVMGPQQYMSPTTAGPVPFSSPQGQQSMQTLLDAAQQSMSTEQSQPVQDGFGNHFFDTADVSKFNFDPSTFNFGNHYGALEFGMLGHMATGAAETPPSDSGTQYNQNFASPVGVSGFADSPIRARSFSMTQDQAVPEWQSPNASEMVRPDGAAQMGPGVGARPNANRQRRNPAAIPINVSHTRDGSGRLTGTLTPPATELPPSQIAGGRATPNTSSQDQFGTESTQSSPQLTRLSAALTNGRAIGQQSAAMDAAYIYESTNQSYDYVGSWHHLRNHVLKRFNQTEFVRIAKALASIRPSFIAATRSLGTQDLIFQEKTFQRTLYMYKDFLADNCTPTLICRRTGEVAAVSSEFCTLTGWSREVLIGEKPNLNENYGFKGSGDPGSGTASATIPGTGASSARGGMNTPRAPDSIADPSKPHPVYLADLMDDSNVVEFYEDFARMAFGEPRGRVTTRTLLYKYKTKADMANSISAAQGEGQDAATGNHRPKFHGDENYVDCACIWTVKRDPFETPMMILLNVSIQAKTSSGSCGVS